MFYAVIYEVDTSEYEHPDGFGPPLDPNGEGGRWHETEGDECFEIPERFYNDEIADAYGWKDGHHRKWSAFDLTEEEFDDFITECKLCAIDGDGQALGLIGYGFSNAIVFQGYDGDDVKSSAWVTPYCEKEVLAEWLAENHEHVPAALVDVPGQRYLLGDVKDQRKPWDAVSAVLHRRYA
jgi:hypothetical protein